MKIAILSITQAGQRLSEQLSQVLGTEHSVTRYAFARYAEAGVQPFEKTDALMQAHFREYDAWICICACGIAVRAIAPYIVSKQTDPAVVVIDDQAQFAIPVLSGHVGGANALSRQIARITGAQAAVTTATDVGGHFSPDSFAAANGLIITDFAAAKEIAASVLAGEKIGVASVYPVTGLPAECVMTDASERPDMTGMAAAKRTCDQSVCIRTDDLRSGIMMAGGSDDESRGDFSRPMCGNYRTGIYIGPDPDCRPFAVTLPLIPKNIVLGIGCRRGVSEDTIAAHVREALCTGILQNPAARQGPEAEEGRMPQMASDLSKGAEQMQQKTLLPDDDRRLAYLLQRVCAVATIDRKADEPGLAAYCAKLGVPLVTYTAGQLQAVDFPDHPDGEGAGSPKGYCAYPVSGCGPDARDRDGPVPGRECSQESAFASSEFVRQTVGVDNVCERSAVLCSGGTLILPKTAGGGVTVAAAVKPVFPDGRREVSI